MSSERWVPEENVRKTRFRGALPEKRRNEDQVVSEKRQREEIESP